MVAAAVLFRLPGTLQLLYRPLTLSRIRLGSKLHPQGFSSSRSFQELGQLGNGWDEPKTIYALSTAPGKSAIAIVRISGFACMDVRPAKSLFGFTFYLWVPRCIPDLFL